MEATTVVENTVTIWTFFPEILTAIVAVLSGLLSYHASSKKCKADIASLRESNAHDIERLMKQHEIDLASLERKHQMELEKLREEHRLKLEEQKQQMEGQLGADMMKEMLGAAFSTPEVKQAMGQSLAGAIHPRTNNGRGKR